MSNKHLPRHVLAEAVAALSESGGSQAEAARRLGLTRSCLRRRIDTATLQGFQVWESGRRPRYESTERAAHDPTPQEIARACEAFVANRPRRRAGVVRWTMPLLTETFAEDGT